MKIFLVAGFNAGLPVVDLDMIAGQKFDGIRRDVTVEHIHEYLEEVRPYPSLDLMCILRTRYDCSPDDLVVEAGVIARAIVDAGYVGRASIQIGNEPNISPKKLSTWAWQPVTWAGVVTRCAQAIWAVSAGIDVIAGGISNTGSGEQAWLRRALPTLHPKVICAYHTYRTEATPETPLKNFASRADEFAALMALLGSRRRADTETGWHGLVSTVGGPSFPFWDWGNREPKHTVQFTPEQIAEFLVRECHLNADALCESISIYQLNDAEADHDQGFGIQTNARVLKPAAYVALAYKASIVTPEPPVEPLPPIPPVPPTVPIVSFLLVDPQGGPIAGAPVVFRLDDATYSTVVSAMDGSVTYHALIPGVGVWVVVDAPGYRHTEERRLIPTVHSSGPLPEWPTTLVVPPLPPVASFYIQDTGGGRIAGASASFQLDADVPPVVVVSDGLGDIHYEVTAPGAGVWVHCARPGYIPLDERRLIPTVSTMGPLPEWPVSVTLAAAPTRRSYSKAELMDIQTDLMIFCPAVKPTFVNGFDEAHQIRERSDKGVSPHGIINGWMWCTTIANYSADERQIIYAACRSYGFTHFTLHVGAMGPGAGYHGIFPLTQHMADRYGAMQQAIHWELLDAGLIPIWAGVSPEVPLAPGLDPNTCLIAMTDWDNSAEAATRLDAIGRVFPTALLYYELPEGAIIPTPSATDPVPPSQSNGGAWIRGMQQRWPNFVGVMYEVNKVDGLTANDVQLTQCRVFWRDVQEVQCEIDTYWKFWDNYGFEEARAYNDALHARCPWLYGYMSGSSPHPPVPPGGDLDWRPAVGDMIEPSLVQTVNDPRNLFAWPVTTTITRLDLNLTGVHVVFDKREGPGRWPDQVTPGWTGPLQYSLGLCLKIDGQWYGCAPIELWYGLSESGGQIQAQVSTDSPLGQIPAHWFYNSRWGAMHGYQPAPGEEVGLFVCAGDARNNYHERHERSNIVTFPLPVHNQQQSFEWRG